MLGYGPFHYRYASGREGDASLLALSSRKRYISLYVLCGTEAATSPSSTPSGSPKADIGKSCMRFKRPATSTGRAARADRRGGEDRPGRGGVGLTSQVMDIATGFRQDAVAMSQPTRAEIMRSFVPASPFAKDLGIEIVDLHLDHAELRLPWSPRLATMGEVVHGGAIATLLDTAGMAAAWSDDTVPENFAGATVSMSVSFAAAARATDLRPAPPSSVAAARCASAR